MASRAAGADLSRYPRPNVAIDVAVLTARPAASPTNEPGELLLLVEERESAPLGFVLPGRFLRPRETVADCVRTALAEKANLDVPGEPRLLRVFDDPDRDARGWTLSIGHYLTLPWSTAERAEGRWVPVRADGSVPRSTRLLFDHALIAREAVRDLRQRYEAAPDPGGMLTGKFTMTDLRLLHETVLGEKLLRDTFKRRMEPDLVKVDGATRSDGGRPAQLYVHGDAPDSPVALSRLRLPRPRD